MLNANHFRTSDTGIIVRSNHTAAYKAAHTWESEEHKKNEAYEYAGILRDFCVIPRKGNGANRKYQRVLGILLACKNPVEMSQKFASMRDGYTKL